jgi:uncharacterized protein with HEPN domain
VRDDRAKLLDIMEAIEKIERYSGVERVVFERDELIQTWVVYHLQVIGEAVTQLSEETRAQAADIPWRAIAAMRHALVHAYFRVDLDEVWNAVTKDLPGLKSRLQQLLREPSE